MRMNPSTPTKGYCVVKQLDFEEDGGLVLQPVSVTMKDTFLSDLSAVNNALLTQNWSMLQEIVKWERRCFSLVSFFSFRKTAPWDGLEHYIQEISALIVFVGPIYSIVTVNTYL